MRSDDSAPVFASDNRTGGLRFPSHSGTSCLGPGHGDHREGERRRNLSPKITDSARVSQIVAFVDSHRGGWYRHGTVYRCHVFRLRIYEGTEFKGSFGVGKNFLETQRDGGFYSQDATSDEANTFLALLPPTSRLAIAGIENGPDPRRRLEYSSGVEQLPESQLKRHLRHLRINLIRNG